MNLAIVTGTAVAVAFAALGTAKIGKTPSMQARAQHVGLSVESYQLIGAAEVAGAAGVAAGLAFAPIGYAAGAGLLLLLAGALGAHVRSGDRLAEVAPALVFGTGTVVYVLALGAS